MAWIRIDDNEADHPKILALTEAVGYEGYYRLARLRGYCARHGTGGQFTRATARELGVRQRLLDAMIDARLIDVVDDQIMKIHDWVIYNGRTVAERVAAYLEQHPDASANDVFRAVGGNRKLVVAEVSRLRQGGTEAVPGAVPEAVPKVVPEEVPKVVPSPAPEEPNPTHPPTSTVDAAGRVAVENGQHETNLERLDPFEVLHALREMKGQ